jgi:hypothetical protein
VNSGQVRRSETETPFSAGLRRPDHAGNIHSGHESEDSGLAGRILAIASGDPACYKVRMAENTFDIETVRQVEVLAKSLGGLAECKRLGFIFQDEQGVMSLSTAGLGYLLYVKARNITSLAEAFAAGYECAVEETDAKL